MKSRNRVATMMVLVIVSAVAVGTVSASEAHGGEPALAAGSNRAFYHEASTSASRRQIWALWTDPASWATWDRGLTSARAEETLALGTVGTIVDLGGRESRFTVTEYEELSSYAFETRLPLARLVVRRSFIDGVSNDADEPTLIRHDVSFSGILGRFWARRFGPGFRTLLPPTMYALITEAERT